MSFLENNELLRRLPDMTKGELEALAEELRERIISTVSANGGHLASNLGLVETMIALHTVFDSPRDSILFDVGHQAYAHKLLTGRGERFDTLRRPGGISGFVKRGESEHDKLSAGHSGTSLSAAVGIATAEALSGGEGWTVALIGDGSFTNGMIYEALNNCTGRGLRLIVILNDNEMSISPNVGALSVYFRRIATSRRYFSFKHTLKNAFSRLPIFGEPLIGGARAIRNFIKRVLVKSNLFEDFGLDYLGPVDGNDLGAMISVLREAKTKDTPCLVHIRTKKGLGYKPAEERPDLYHATSPFDRERGIEAKEKRDFSAAFGQALENEARENGRICAVTAAMTSGTGLSGFAGEFPTRFFDVGIAEEHAVTFSAGLAVGGYIPVFAVYSTFAQRICDQLLHDIALQKLPLVLALDRCGFVDGDGVTHQGIFDIPLLSSIPDVEIWSPAYRCELAPMLHHALGRRALTILRYPRGGDISDRPETMKIEEDGALEWCDIGDSPAKCVVTYGRLTSNALEGARLHGSARVISLKRIIPLPDSLPSLLSGMERICIVEECEEVGGIGERISAMLATKGVCAEIRTRAVDNSFGAQGKASELFAAFGMMAENIAEMLE